MARDAGLSAHELRCIAQLSPDAAQLLSRRMSVQNLDVDMVSETDIESHARYAAAMLHLRR